MINIKAGWHYLTLSSTSNASFAPMSLSLMRDFDMPMTKKRSWPQHAHQPGWEVEDQSQVWLGLMKGQVPRPLSWWERWTDEGGRREDTKELRIGWQTSGHWSQAPIYLAKIMIWINVPCACASAETWIKIGTTMTSINVAYLGNTWDLSRHIWRHHLCMYMNFLRTQFHKLWRNKALKTEHEQKPL